MSQPINPSQISSFFVKVKVAHKKNRFPNTIQRKTFSFRGFEDASLATNFGKKLGDFLREFIRKNEAERVIAGKLWLIKEPQYGQQRSESAVIALRPDISIPQSDTISITPSNNFDEVLKEILKAFDVS